MINICWRVVQLYTQVDSVSGDDKKHILNHSGSETGIKEIYKVLYINATDKNLPGDKSLLSKSL